MCIFQKSATIIRKKLSFFKERIYTVVYIKTNRLNPQDNDPKVHLGYAERFFAISTAKHFYYGLVAYTLAASLFLLLVGVVLSIFAPALYKSIEANSTAYLVLNSVAMYIVGTGALYLCVRGSKTKKREKSPIGAEDIILLFFIGEFFTVLGNFLGQMITFILTALTGFDNILSIDQALNSYPLWCIFLIVVIAAPIFEELVFRKLMIDRFSIYGDKLAIIASAIAFGLFHGNFGQFFYTAAVGLIWGYVYAKSGMLRYSVIMHMLMNFFGGFLPMYISSGSPFFSVLGTFGLLVIQYGSAIAGFVLFILAIVKHWYRLEGKPQIYLPNDDVKKFMFFNSGFIAFFLVCAFQFAVNHFPDIFGNLLS